MARPNDSGAIQAHVRGLREAKAAFQALPVAMRERLLTATETTVREIVRLAKSRLASNPSIRTRSLYNQVGWTLNAKNGRGRAGVGSGSSTISFAHVGGITKKIKVKGILVPGRNGGAAGAKLIRPSRYAHLVEFGSRSQKAEPFMVPAAKSQEQPYLDRCLRAGKDVERDVAAIGMRTL
jgi:hypothetical protein